MRQSHLLGPPPSPAAEAAAREQKFTPSPSAWLRCVWVNYCCYAPDAPKKDTVVYTGRREAEGAEGPACRDTLSFTTLPIPRERAL